MSFILFLFRRKLSDRFWFNYLRFYVAVLFPVSVLASANIWTWRLLLYDIVFLVLGSDAVYSMVAGFWYLNLFSIVTFFGWYDGSLAVYLFLIAIWFIFISALSCFLKTMVFDKDSRRG